MKNVFHVMKTIGCFTAICLAGQTAYAGHGSTSANSTSSDGMTRPLTYVAVSGGYGNYQDMANGTGQTGFTRVGFGARWLFNNWSFGGELGVQSGNRMQLTSSTLSDLYGGIAFPPNVYLTIRPPVDILAALKFNFMSPVFVQVKAGGVYSRTMIDTGAVEAINKWQPEVQVGLGWDVTSCHHVVLSYQRFFGNKPTLTNVDLNNGTAKLDHLPTWQAGMISYEIDL